MPSPGTQLDRRPGRPGWRLSPQERDALALPSGEPVMLLQRTTFTADGVVVEFARGVHAASRFTWTYDFPIPA
jgi:GntR family transcriptional regulator